MVLSSVTYKLNEWGLNKGIAKNMPGFFIEVISYNLLIYKELWDLFNGRVREIDYRIESRY